MTRREAILDAALHAFSDHGYEAATIADVCRRSGASVGSVYHHFEGKEGLAAALFAEGLRAYQAGFLAALEAHPDDAEGGIRAAVGHHLRWVEKNPDLARWLLAGRRPEVRLAGEAAVRDLNRQAFAQGHGWIARQVEAGGLRALPRDVYVPVLIGPAQELCRAWLSGDVAVRPTRRAAELADAAWAALRAHPKERSSR
jgi:AcrR family transcriptional regulator